MSDTSPTGSPAGTPIEADRLSSIHHTDVTSELADAERAAAAEGREPVRPVDPILPLAEALTFGIDGATPDANNARASAAAGALAAAAEGDEPVGARAVVAHGGDLAAAVNSPEFLVELDAVTGEIRGLDSAPHATQASDLTSPRNWLLTVLEQRGVLWTPELDVSFEDLVASTSPERHLLASEIEDEGIAPVETPLERTSADEGRSQEDERDELTEAGPRSVPDRIRAKLHLDRQSSSERLGAVGITLHPQETSTLNAPAQARPSEPPTYGLGDTAR
jgi:hypothetical protein